MDKESMRTHTPGPWEESVHVPRHSADAEWSVVMAGGGDRVAMIDEWPDSPGEAEANARLIAAAPDLLAALDSLFEHCAMVHKHWGDGCNQREATAAIESARAAIAKAKGEQS